MPSILKLFTTLALLTVALAKSDPLANQPNLVARSKHGSSHDSMPDDKSRHSGSRSHHHGNHTGYPSVPSGTAKSSYNSTSQTKKDAYGNNLVVSSARSLLSLGSFGLISLLFI